MKRSSSLFIAGVVAASLGRAAVARADELPPLPPPDSPPPLPPEAPPTSPPSSPEIGEPPAAPPPRSAEDLAKESRTSLMLDAGYSLRVLDLVAVRGGDMRVGIGRQDDKIAAYGFLEGFVGRTFGGLTAWEVKGGVVAERRFSALRLGVGGDLGYTFVVRKTVDYTMWSAVVGAFVQGSYDLYAWGPKDDHAVFVTGRFNTNFFWYVFEFGPTVSLGARY